jgi:CBS domain-containing protein
MATVRDILAKKSSSVISVAPNETVLHAAELRSERGIGGLVVTNGGRLARIFTERDILRRVVAQRLDPATTRVAEAMTAPVTVCAADTPVDECAAMMTVKRIRHLPVVTGRDLAGVITIGDVLAFQVTAQQATIDYMHHFMSDLR